MQMLLDFAGAQASTALILALGMAAAYATGKAIALTWRPFWHAPAYMVLLAAVTRFCHFALFEEPLLDIAGYVREAVVLALAASLGFQRVRVLQMRTQYDWIYEQASLLSWRRKT